MSIDVENLCWYSILAVTRGSLRTNVNTSTRNYIHRFGQLGHWVYCFSRSYHTIRLLQHPPIDSQARCWMSSTCYNLFKPRYRCQRTSEHHEVGWRWKPTNSVKLVWAVWHSTIQIISSCVMNRTSTRDMAGKRNFYDIIRNAQWHALEIQSGVSTLLIQ